MKKIILFSIIIVAMNLTVFAQPPEMELQLDAVEKQALDYSPRLKVAEWEAEAAQAKAKSQSALLWPRLSLEGSVRYITEVPELEINLPIPHAEPMVMTMGDNTNYSIGLQLGWQLWDSFAIRAASEALEQQAESKRFEIQAIRENIILKTRLAYFQTQLALEQVEILREALLLAQAQNRDIQAKSQAGASSKIDQISSRMDVTERQKQLREARTTLAEALRQVFSLTGQVLDKDIRLPLGEKGIQRLPQNIESATIQLRLDSMEQTKQKLMVQTSKAKLQSHPNILAMLKNVEAAKQMVRSTAAGYWPSVTAYVKSSLDYPNQVVLEQVQQNTAGAALSWTLWQYGRTQELVNAQKAGVNVAQQMQRQMENELILIWDQAQDQKEQLEAVQKLNQQTEKDARALARLTYEAYLAGRANYLDVQSANLSVLRASTQVVMTETQLMIQLALLNSLQ